MFSFNVKADFSAVMRQLKTLDKQVVIPAASTAINKTLNTVRTETARDVKTETALPVTKVKQRMTVTRSNGNSLTGKIEVKRRSLQNIIEWVSPAKKRPKAFSKQPGVVSKAWGKSKTYRGSFIGHGRNSGKALVFSRTGKDRDSKLKALAGPSVRATFILKKLEDARQRTVKLTWIKNFNYELRYRLDKHFK